VSADYAEQQPIMALVSQLRNNAFGRWRRWRGSFAEIVTIAREAEQLARQSYDDCETIITIGYRTTPMECWSVEELEQEVEELEQETTDYRAKSINYIEVRLWGADSQGTRTIEVAFFRGRRAPNKYPLPVVKLHVKGPDEAWVQQAAARMCDAVAQHAPD